MWDVNKILNLTYTLILIYFILYSWEGSNNVILPAKTSFGDNFFVVSVCMLIIIINSSPHWNKWRINIEKTYTFESNDLSIFVRSKRVSSGSVKNDRQGFFPIWKLAPYLRHIDYG